MALARSLETNDLKATGAKYVADMLKVNQTLTSVKYGVLSFHVFHTHFLHFPCCPLFCAFMYSLKGNNLDNAAKEQLRKAAGSHLTLQL